MGFRPYASSLTIPVSVTLDTDTSFQVATRISFWIERAWALPMQESAIASAVDVRIRLYILPSVAVPLVEFDQSGPTVLRSVAPRRLNDIASVSMPRYR